MAITDWLAEGLPGRATKTVEVYAAPTRVHRAMPANRRPIGGSAGAELGPRGPGRPDDLGKRANQLYKDIHFPTIHIISSSTWGQKENSRKQDKNSSKPWKSTPDGRGSLKLLVIYKIWRVCREWIPQRSMNWWRF